MCIRDRLFVFDWRMGLACLIPMVIGLVCLMTMMTGTGMKFFEEYQRAGERISAEATEYVRGIPVVKVFQQTVYSFKSFHAAILSYRDLASGYAMMCRMPYTLLTVVLNAMFLFLMPLGMVLIGGAADGWAVLADLVFYIFFAPQLAFMKMCIRDRHGPYFRYGRINKRQLMLSGGDCNATPALRIQNYLQRRICMTFEIHSDITNRSMTCLLYTSRCV